MKSTFFSSTEIDKHFFLLLSFLCYTMWNFVLLQSRRGKKTVRLLNSHSLRFSLSNIDNEFSLCKTFEKIEIWTFFFSFSLSFHRFRDIKYLIFHYCFSLFIRFIWKLFSFEQFFMPSVNGVKKTSIGEKGRGSQLCFNVQLITIDVHVVTGEVSETEMLSKRAFEY